MEGIQTLKDGRTLAYAQYGKLDGRPLFLFHGMPGSRLFQPPEEITTQMGIRLITVDRPGYGRSTFQPGRRIQDWPQDVLQLAQALKLDSFLVAGHSGGGPYAAACALALPQQVKGASLICSISPVGTPGALEHMDGLNRMGYRVGRHIPWLIWRFLIWIFYHSGRTHPEVIMERGAASRPLADAELWKQGSVRQVCYASVVEAFCSGTLGHAWEARLMTRPWDLAFEAVHVPVHIWHGTADRTTPVAMAYALADKIPGSALHVFKDEAHLLIFPYWHEILQAMLQTSGWIGS